MADTLTPTGNPTALLLFDNVTAPDGTTNTFVSRVKNGYGADGSYADVTTTAGMPTALYSPAVGAAAFATPTAVSVTGTSGAATLLVAARTGAPGTGRVRAILENGAAVQVMICPAAASTTGIPLLGTIGAALTLNTTAAIYAFVASGTGTVSVLEEF